MTSMATLPSTFCSTNQQLPVHHSGSVPRSGNSDGRSAPSLTHPFGLVVHWDVLLPAHGTSPLATLTESQAALHKLQVDKMGRLSFFGVGREAPEAQTMGSDVHGRDRCTLPNHTAPRHMSGYSSAIPDVPVIVGVNAQDAQQCKARRHAEEALLLDDDSVLIPVSSNLHLLPFPSSDDSGVDSESDAQVRLMPRIHACALEHIIVHEFRPVANVQSVGDIQALLQQAQEAGACPSRCRPRPCGCCVNSTRKQSNPVLPCALVRPVACVPLLTLASFERMSIQLGPI
jgi:hypothetical protein